MDSTDNTDTDKVGNYVDISDNLYNLFYKYK